MSNSTLNFHENYGGKMEKYTYRELQKMAKSMLLPANLKKDYLIKVILVKQFGSPAALSAIIDQAKRERSSLKIKEEPRDLQDFTSAIFSPTISSTTEDVTSILSQTTLRYQRYKHRDELKRARSNGQPYALDVGANKRVKFYKECITLETVKRNLKEEHARKARQRSQICNNFEESPIQNNVWLNSQTDGRLPCISDAFNIADIGSYCDSALAGLPNHSDLNVMDQNENFIIDLTDDIDPLNSEDLFEDQSLNNTACERAESPSILSEIKHNTINELVPFSDIMDLMEDALGVADNDKKCMKELQLDEMTWCTDCEWTGRRLYLELHLLKKHVERVYQSRDFSWDVSFIVGDLVRHGRLVELLQDCRGALYVLCATFVRPDAVSVAILSVTSDERVTATASIIAYSNVTVQPYSWCGHVDRLPSDFPSVSFTNCLKVCMNQVDLLPDSMHGAQINNFTSDDIHISMFVKVIVC